MKADSRKYPELVLTPAQKYDEPPNWNVLSEFVTGIVDYCCAAGFIVNRMEAAERFIPECLQRLYMEWHGFGEFTNDSFTLGMLNGWMNEWRDLVENGNAPDGLREDGKAYTIRDVRNEARRAFMRVKNHDDRGSAEEFRKLVNDNVRSWVREQLRKREEDKAHRAKLAQTVRVRLRKSDVDLLVGMLKAGSDVSFPKGFADRVVA